ncbi:MAG: glycosyltransferase family 2 protein [Desulfobacterales bacterium]|nr:glycosyltransferase family 2 protein [Desulfobacterales bacterium]
MTLPERFIVVIPVYNHGRTLAAVVRKCMKSGFAVIVVDDGSTDGGSHAVQDAPPVCVLRHGVNRGKGAALLTGMRAAVAQGADWAITLDADGQHDPEEAHVLIQALRDVPPETRPIVVGCRKAMLAAGAPWTSRFGREFSNFWIKMAGGPLTTDSQSGFRIYPLPEVLDLGVTARRYQFEIEVLVKAGWHGIPVIEAPIGVIYPPGRERISHFHPFFDFLRNTGMFTRLITQRVMHGMPQ